MLEDTRQTSLCKPVSKTILLGCENGSFPSLFDCHLAISQSSTACYTSFKRGDSGLPADVKIRTIFQLIGIVWSYFLRISRYQCIYICICIQIRIQIVSKYLVSFPSLVVVSRSVSHLSLITFCLHFSMAGGNYLALVQERAEMLRFYTWIGNEPKLKDNMKYCVERKVNSKSEES